MKYWIAGIVALVIIFSAVGYFVPLVEVAYAETIEYQDTETYLEDETYTASEPYEDMETYTEKEPYQGAEIHTVEEPLDYQIVESYSKKDTRRVPDNLMSFALGRDVTKEQSYLTSFVKIKNTDDVEGMYSIKVTIYTIDKYTYYRTTGEHIPSSSELKKLLSPNSIGYMLGLVKSSSKTSDINILPGEIKTVQQEFIIEPERDYYRLEENPVVSGTKQVEKEREVTKYRDVEKSRNVTKYREVEKTRQVEKQRPVIKQKTEIRYKRVPLFESLFTR